MIFGWFKKRRELRAKQMAEFARNEIVRRCLKDAGGYTHRLNAARQLSVKVDLTTVDALTELLELMRSADGMFDSMTAIHVLADELIVDNWSRDKLADMEHEVRCLSTYVAVYETRMAKLMAKYPKKHPLLAIVRS